MVYKPAHEKTYKKTYVTIVGCVEVFMAQSTQWGHVERGQFTYPHVYWAGLVL